MTRGHTSTPVITALWEPKITRSFRENVGYTDKNQKGRVEGVISPVIVFSYEQTVKVYGLRLRNIHLFMTTKSGTFSSVISFVTLICVCIFRFFNIFL